MIILAGMKLEELENLMQELGATKFRARQIHNWIYSKSVSSIDEMTNLSLNFREQLKEIAVVTDTKIKVKQVSRDGTIKYLVEYPDGECVETVLMRFDNRANLTACVSSQVGCAVNCSFCATAKGGFRRNLSYKEIIEQIQNERFIIMDPKFYQSGVLVMERFSQANIKPSNYTVLNQIYLINKTIHESNVGAFLLEHFSKENHDTVGIPLSPALTVNIGLVWRKCSNIRTEVAKFIEFAHKSKNYFLTM